MDRVEKESMNKIWIYMSNSIALSNNNIELRVQFSEEIVNLEKDYGKNNW